MNSPKVEADPALQRPQMTAAVQADPREVERFEAALRRETLRDEEPRRMQEPGGEEPAASDGGAGLADGTRFLPPLPAADRAAPRPVTRVRRAALFTHAARSRAMQPVAELLAGLHQRAAGRAVQGMTIVPPEPNPLRLTLQLSMREGEFVVQVRAGLEPGRREEVRQALHVLQAALAARLKLPARVVLLA
jgi:hypothetical protein